MIEKTQKSIMYSMEDNVLDINQKDIEQYLSFHEQKYPIRYYFR